VFYSSTGVLPSVTVTNTTYRATLNFHATNSRVKFESAYPQTFFSRETTPPYDVILEVPSDTGTFRIVKTAVNFQTCNRTTFIKKDVLYEISGEQLILK
jgi:hypothetical protein